MIRRTLFLLLYLLPVAAQACPGCNTGIDSGQGTAATHHILAGFSWSVLLLIGAALSALGTLARLAVRAAQDENFGQSTEK